MLFTILWSSALAQLPADRHGQGATHIVSTDPHDSSIQYFTGPLVSSALKHLEIYEGSSSRYIITLNSSQNATLYCYSDHLHVIQLVSEECWTCEEFRRTNCTTSEECMSCKDACSEETMECPALPADYSTCLAVTSRADSRRYYCMGYTGTSAVLVVKIDILQHVGPDTCHGNTIHANSITYNVTYKETILCVNASNVTTQDAGHLLATGYTTGPFVPRKKSFASDEEEDTPKFESFCVVTVPKLWKKKMGTSFPCNGSRYIMKDELPCLHFSPNGRVLRLPSLEHCSAPKMVGIVIAMIIGMILSYVLFITCVNISEACCRSRRKEMEMVPLVQNHSSYASRATLQGSVVKLDAKCLRKLQMQ